MQNFENESNSTYSEPTNVEEFASKLSEQIVDDSINVACSQNGRDRVASQRDFSRCVNIGGTDEEIIKVIAYVLIELYHTFRRCSGSFNESLKSKTSHSLLCSFTSNFRSRMTSSVISSERMDPM
jgi:hypothetical protein